MRAFLCLCLLLIATPVFATPLENSAAVGDTAKNFTLPDANGNSITLYDRLKEGSVVLSFYRGGWCPVCNIQLHGYQERLAEIEKLGATLIAISPETPSNAEVTMVKHNLTFTVLSDQGNHVASEYGILWAVPEEGRENFSKWLEDSAGKTLEDYNAQAGYELPVPATFVIDPNGSITYAFADVDYKNRADIDDILAALAAINAKETP